MVLFNTLLCWIGASLDITIFVALIVELTFFLQETGDVTMRLNLIHIFRLIRVGIGTPNFCLFPFCLNTLSSPIFSKLSPSLFFFHLICTISAKPVIIWNSVKVTAVSMTDVEIAMITYKKLRFIVTS